MTVEELRNKLKEISRELKSMRPETVVIFATSEVDYPELSWLKNVQLGLASVQEDDHDLRNVEFDSGDPSKWENRPNTIVLWVD